MMERWISVSRVKRWEVELWARRVTEAFSLAGMTPKPSSTTKEERIGCNLDLEFMPAINQSEN
jgi:hypothetical protein